MIVSRSEQGKPVKKLVKINSTKEVWNDVKFWLSTAVVGAHLIKKNIKLIKNKMNNFLACSEGKEAFPRLIRCFAEISFSPQVKRHFKPSFRFIGENPMLFEA